LVNVVLWIVAVLLAVAFLLSGLMKLTRPAPKLVEMGMGWVDDMPLGLVRFIGAMEVLAALGLVLPPLFGIAPILAPLAATGLVIIMIGAIVTHARRKDPIGIIIGNTVLLLLAAFVAWGRFGPYSF
jgi:uncharacterized membrane protein YphA (DoxX/SURF4 family)